MSIFQDVSKIRTDVEAQTPVIANVVTILQEQLVCLKEIAVSLATIASLLKSEPATLEVTHGVPVQR